MGGIKGVDFNEFADITGESYDKTKAKRGK